MECHGCKKEISKNEFKKVGVWDFCDSCFDDLIKKAEDKSSHPQETPNGETPEILPPSAVEVSDSKKQCTICEMLIKEEDTLKIGSLIVCSSCHQELIQGLHPLR